MRAYCKWYVQIRGTIHIVFGKVQLKCLGLNITASYLDTSVGQIFQLAANIFLLFYSDLINCISNPSPYSNNIIFVSKQKF
jgi:hypothetical protein